MANNKHVIHPHVTKLCNTTGIQSHKHALKETMTKWCYHITNYKTDEQLCINYTVQYWRTGHNRSCCSGTQVQIILITISIIIITSIYYNLRHTTRKHNKEPTTNYHSGQHWHTRTMQEVQPNNTKFSTRIISWQYTSSCFTSVP